MEYHVMMYIIYHIMFTVITNDGIRYDFHWLKPQDFSSTMWILEDDELKSLFERLKLDDEELHLSPSTMVVNDGIVVVLHKKSTMVVNDGIVVVLHKKSTMVVNDGIVVVLHKKSTMVVNDGIVVVLS
ncbi:hypothetical protein RhiirC2_851197 [Rhizophagus irregularis]|uniref:Uncharacterized protein n=1 Tax=Rhizophagus irregularis TaxID=588596 RepID=A0A2N1N4B3_9GLOM|nr:hypothetical protein RhiirC2_851197 [Rhizophagus irregularis]